MKQILIALLGFILWQVSAVCVGSDNRLNNNLYAVVAEENLTGELSPQEQTEENFYRFVREILKKSPLNPPATLVCTDFKNTTEAFDRIINFINPASERIKFDSKHTYETKLLKMEYTEENIDGGFAKLTLNFKNRKAPKEYTVVFK